MHMLFNKKTISKKEIGTKSQKRGKEVWDQNSMETSWRWS